MISDTLLYSQMQNSHKQKNRELHLHVVGLGIDIVINDVTLLHQSRRRIESSGEQGPDLFSIVENYLHMSEIVET